MTNFDYFEKNKISFADAMKIFKEQKVKGTKSFNKFLASERVEPKFKIGDLIVLQQNEETRKCSWEHNIVLEVINTRNVYDKNCYVVKCLTPNSPVSPSVGEVLALDIGFVDRNCVIY